MHAKVINSYETPKVFVKKEQLHHATAPSLTNIMMYFMSE